MNTMHRTAVSAALLALAATLPVAALAGETEGARDIARYEQAAEPAVQQMPFQELHNWQALNDSTLAVWTAEDQPWLVKVDASCSGLMKAGNIGLSSHGGQVSVGTDSVDVNGSHCKIASIRPVDYHKVMAMGGSGHMRRHHVKKAAHTQTRADAKAEKTTVAKEEKKE